MSSERIDIKDLGYNSRLEKYRLEQNLGSLGVGRVIQEHKDRYKVYAETGELDCELIGNLRYTATSMSELPAVGDWVSISEYDEGKALIHAILPRYSVLSRKAAGKSANKQIIACNIDYGLIVQSVNRDFNINRLERYLTICNDSNIQPIIVITKTDLINAEELNELMREVNSRITSVSIVYLSNKTKAGMEDLRKLIHEEKTYCLLGSSGVGKSTLINNLNGEKRMKTAAISGSVDRGRHVTTHRELVPIVNGAILIDNPGMREVGIADSSDGLNSTFETIYKLAQHCKFSDCTHTTEKDCAVKSAIEMGEIEKSSFDNFLKMEREREHYEATIAEKRKKDKDFGKIVKHFKNLKNSNRQ